MFRTIPTRLFPSLRCQLGSSRTFVQTFSEPQASQRHLRLATSVAVTASAGALVFSSPSKFLLADSASGAVPPFSLDSSKYDQSTFLGRLWGIYEKIDPRTLLITDKELKDAQKLLEQFKSNGNKKPDGVSDADLWEARRIVEAIIHPVTGEPILAIGRMSAFVPMNVPLCALMLMSTTTTQSVFAQWLNQTYNAVNNYSNRSGATVDWAPLISSYVIAAGSAVSIAFAGGKLLKVLPALQGLGPFVPYLAVVSAGSANVGFTRYEEWNGGGIPVRDEEGRDLGMSKLAGKQAVLQTIATRVCFLPIFPMMLPPLVMKKLKPVLPFAPLAMFTEVIVIAAAIGLMLPMALSILPEKMELSTSGLESEFQNLKDSKGNPITKVYANKGL
jgi:sideroflexin-5